ncbi:signal peptidase complex catalytic subunit SEC11C isoform X1 [Phalacrocorax carbo]|uniref:signal peptidase complex catalytic subunit SEC11C isoform X1 n=2 Tax=Neoaves TaxID=3078114 RepID=UPI00311A7AE9
MSCAHAEAAPERVRRRPPDPKDTAQEAGAAALRLHRRVWLNSAVSGGLSARPRDPSDSKLVGHLHGQEARGLAARTLCCSACWELWFSSPLRLAERERDERRRETTTPGEQRGSGGPAVVAASGQALGFRGASVFHRAPFSGAAREGVGSFPPPARCGPSPGSRHGSLRGPAAHEQAAVSSALMIWKGLIVITGSESPIVVVLSGSMEPAFHRGDLLFLTNFHDDPIRAGEIVVFKVEGRDIPIVHRVIKIHEKENGNIKFLTKGDNNEVDDRGLYKEGQNWLEKKDVVGRARGFLPYVGMVTIIMNDYPKFKYALLAVMGAYVLLKRES